jgi:hypothetical protein
LASGSLPETTHSKPRGLAAGRLKPALFATLEALRRAAFARAEL